MGLSLVAGATLLASCLAGTTLGTYMGSDIDEGHVRGLLVGMGLAGGAIAGIVFINLVLL